MDYNDFTTTNAFITGLTRRVEIALEECCMTLEGSSLGSVPGWFFLDFKCSNGILLQACMPENDEWNGEIAVIRKDELLANPHM